MSASQATENVLNRGAVVEGERIRVNVCIPYALKCSISTRHGDIELRRDGDAFTGIFDKDEIELPYLMHITDDRGQICSLHDAYCFKPELSDFDIYLFKKGELMLSYETFGAHIRKREGVSGVRFVVWAPNARNVSVVGNFNRWSPEVHRMFNVSDSGIWELFVPDIGEGELYKFAVTNAQGEIRFHTDPYAFYTELRPRTASIVRSLAFNWTDDEWMCMRNMINWRRAPISIYEVHLGSWKRRQDGSFMNYSELANELIPYVKSLGFTHIELLPIMEHPLDQSWGYQTVNYYAPTSRYGTPQQLMDFINRCHMNGIGVILDWSPAHFPDDDYGLSMYDGTHLYDHMDWRRGKHPDWGTNIFNYGRYEVRNFLISSALFWLDKYHADGIRIDAVSSMLYLDYSRKPGEWIPNRYGGNQNLEAIEFLRMLNSRIHEMHPGSITIAEESTAWPGVTLPVHSGGLGFDFKWNMGWMHDTLEYFSKDPVYRKYHQRNLSFSIWYAFSECFILPFSHDEVVHLKGSMLSKMPGDEWQKFANLRLCLAYMFGSPGKKLLFMGSEFGQWREWDVNSSLDWYLLGQEKHYRLSLLVGDLNKMYRRESLHSFDCSHQGFEWIDFNDADNSVISFIRRSEKESLLFVYNMTPVPRYNYRIGVPWPGKYSELLNTDAIEYGGSGVGNGGTAVAERIPMHGREFSLSLTLPPLACEVFEWKGA